MNITHDTSPTSGPTLGDALSNPQVVTQIDDAFPTVALSGKPLPTSELESRLTAIDDVDKQGAAFTIKLSNTRNPLRPIEGADGNVDRLIIPVERLSQADLKVLHQVAEKLDWNARMYWTVDRPKVDITPDTSELQDDASRNSQAWSGSISVPIIYMIPTLLSTYIVLSTKMPGPIYVVLAVMALVWLGLEAYARIYRWAFKNSTKWLRRIEFSGASIFVVIFYGFGGPTSGVNIIIAASMIIGLAGIYFLFIRPKQNQHDLKGLDLPSWMRLKISRSDFAKRMSRLRCVGCDYNIGPSDKCLCPECGLVNYYLAERSDAHDLALKHGAIYSSDESKN